MHKSSFYTVGGTVQAGGGVYISRQADKELLALCRERSFAYVLTPRQMGKSSLMVRTAERLTEEGIQSVIIDLTQLGVQVSAEEWYLGLLTEIADQLMLDNDVHQWWQSCAHLGMTQRLTRFFQKVLLAEVTSSVVIFVDEIDTTLSLDFTDDFFAAIRYFYNRRASKPEFQRLSFVLIGVATPGDLIRDPKRTPFNIGQRVDVTDFTFEEAIPLADGLGLPTDEAQKVLRWVLMWTGGHPYLTQRLCSTITQQGKSHWLQTEVDRVVSSLFFEGMSVQDNNLQFVRDMLTKRAPDVLGVLTIYQEILRGKRPVFDEEQSLVKSHLKLSGVVRRENARLCVRNRIYRKVFDKKWLKEHLPVPLKLLTFQQVVLTSLVVTLLTVGIRQLGVLEPLEIKAFDQMMQRRGELEQDDRLLVVGYTENDIQTIKRTLPNGKILYNTIGKLEKYQAKTIGLDFFRDIPVEPGHDQLLKQIKQSSTIVPICSLGTEKIPGVPPPPGIEQERAGFADIPQDKDGVIRRNLLVASPDPNSACTTPASLGLQLAVNYLDMQPEFTEDGNLKLGKAVFKRLEPNSGGYQNIDALGFQILLNYRGNNAVREISLMDVVNNRFDPNWVKNRIVLIGATAPSLQDIRETPYSDGKQDDSARMPGVVIHAQMVSQILDAATGKRPLFWFFPESVEILWIWGWTFAGGLLAWYFQHPLRLVFGTFGALGILILGNFIIFINAGWIPVAAPVLGFLFADTGVIAYVAFKNRREKERIANQIQEQRETISLLQALLREGANYATQMPSGIHDTARPDSLLNNRYKVTELLGSGGFSNTYLAEDIHRPGKPVCVVKHLQPARTDDVFLEVARRLFKTEAEILELLGQHPQIPQLMAYFEESQQFYLVQEYVLGHCLQVELSYDKRWTEAQVVYFLKDVLQILMFVHNRGVIHRDIKPSNLMRRDKDKRIVLIDFGAVKQIHPQLSQQDNNPPTVAVGTVGYAPPEQFMGQPRLNSDIYALGMIAVQAMTGTPATQLQRDASTALIWREFAENITQEFADILDNMVSYDFHRRYQSAEEVLQALESLSITRIG